MRSGRAVGLGLDFGVVAGVDVAAATVLPVFFTARVDFDGRTAGRFGAARLSRVGFLDAFAGLFVGRLAARAGRVEVRLALTFFLAERTGTLGLRRLAARLAPGRLFAFFAMTV